MQTGLLCFDEDYHPSEGPYMFDATDYYTTLINQYNSSNSQNISKMDNIKDYPKLRGTFGKNYKFSEYENLYLEMQWFKYKNYKTRGKNRKLLLMKKIAQELGHRDMIYIKRIYFWWTNRKYKNSTRKKYYLKRQFQNKAKISGLKSNSD